jgi:tripartite-type tricarboxylate transporter receptor subunit TctC
MVIAAGPSGTFKSVTEVLAAARTNPKSADLAMPSTTARLVVELLKERTGVALFGVPYKGSPAAATDVLGGQVPLLIDTISAAKAGLASGKLRAIAVTSAKPTALLPGVPTVAEQGVPGFDVSAWNALYAPKGTPAPVIARLNAEVSKVLAQPDVQQRLLQLGHEPVGGTPAELAAFERAERAKWEPIIRKAGLKAD